MVFVVGSDVVVRSLGNKRGVVLDVGRGGRYRVQVESVTLTCREQDLEAPEAPRRGSKTKVKRQEPVESSRSEPATPGRVDLHGLTVEDAVAQLTREIDIAARRGADRIEVVHGKGTGRVKNAVHRYLATVSIVASFRLDPANPGVTWVWLR